MKQHTKRITLADFSKKLTPQQRKSVAEEIRYYDLLTSFRDARDKQGITQEELAVKANVNRTTLSQIESGLRNATIATLSKLASALNMELEVKLKMS